MIDIGLLVSVGVIVASVAAVSRWFPPLTLDGRSVGGAVGPAVWFGLAGARLVAVLLDDRGALNRPRDLLLIRGGVEFWAGVVVGAAVLWVGARRAQVEPFARLGDLAVYALVAYGAYEATCLIRDGCFGPPTAIGLRPRGLGQPQLPIGLLVTATAVALATVVRRAARRSGRLAVAAAAAGLGVVRWVAAFALPKIGTAASRPQVESLLVAVMAVIIGSAVALRRRPSDDRSAVHGRPVGPVTT